MDEESSDGPLSAEARLTESIGLPGYQESPYKRIPAFRGQSMHGQKDMPSLSKC